MKTKYWLAAAGLAFLACKPADDEATTTPTEDTAPATDSGVVDTTMPVDTSMEDTAVEMDSMVAETVAETSADSAVDTTIMETSADTAIVETSADTFVPDTFVADTAVADTAMPETSGDPNCGTAPYITIDPLRGAVLSGGSTSPVTISGNICPSTTVTVALTESKTMNVPKGTAFFFTATQTGSLPTFSTEYNINPAISIKLPVTMGMFGTSIPATIADPAWDASTKAFFYMNISSTEPGASGSCASKGGVTFTVTGHSEAIIKYGGGGTSTGAGGDAQAWGTIVTTGTSTAPEYVTIVASKAGCKLTYGGSTAAFFITGRMPMARGTTTIAGGWDIGNP